MRVLLVSPPRALWPFMNEQDNFLLPQALPSLAASLLRAGHEVAVIDCMPEKMGWRSLERAIRRICPDVIAAGENHALYASEVLRLVELARQLDPGVITVLGGAHFTNLGDRYLADHPVDYIVRGEGEVTLTELVDALQTGGHAAARDVAGISYLGDDGPCVNPPRPLLEDLDDLPMPAYELMPMERYGRARYLFSPGGTTIHHSRGCSSSCSFCAWWTQHAHRTASCGVEELAPCWRTKSVERTLAEMEILYRKYDKRCLVFVDPSFNLDPAWNDEFATQLIRKDWDLRWFAFMRTDAILRDEATGVFAKLVRSGLTHLSIGVERADADFLDRSGKPFYGQETTAEAFRLLRENYPQVFRQATFILGVRSETPESVERQLEFARSLQLDYPAFHAYTPFPGTELWEQAEREGWLEITDFDGFDMTTPVMGSETMSRDQVEEAIIRLNQELVNLPWFARGLLSTSSYRRDMYVWWAQVTARVFAHSVLARTNPLRYERYAGLVKPAWYDG